MSQFGFSHRFLLINRVEINFSLFGHFNPAATAAVEIHYHCENTLLLQSVINPAFMFEQNFSLDCVQMDYQIFSLWIHLLVIFFFITHTIKQNSK